VIFRHVSVQGRGQVRWLLLGLSLLASACNEDGDRIVGGGVPTGLVLEEVAGDQQDGKTLEALSQNLVVRARRTDGQAAAGVPVDWEVTAGLGSITALEPVTDSLGLASAQFTSGATLGPSSIVARVVGQVGAAAHFETTTTIWVVSITSGGFVAPTGGDTLFITRGQIVEWVNRDSLEHAVVAINGPGSLFSSDTLANSERFVWEAPVTGIWDYTDPLDDIPPVDVVNQVAASPPPPPPLGIRRD